VLLLLLRLLLRMFLAAAAAAAAQGMGFTKSVPWATKVPATRKGAAAAVEAVFRPSSSKGQQKQSIKVAVV
jgi:hypothetical protein